MSESIAVRLARLEEKVDSFSKSQNELMKLLKGNGKAGYIEEAEKRFSKIELQLAQSKGGKEMLLGIISSGLFAGTIVFIIGKFF